MRLGQQPMHWILLGFLSAIVLLMVSTTSSGAFSVEGAYWQTNSNGAVCGKPSEILGVGCTISFDDTSFTLADWQNTAEQAAPQWTLYDQSTGAAVFQYVHYGILGQVFLYQEPLEEFSSSGAKHLGETHYSYNPQTNAILSANVYITDNPAITWCTYSQQTASTCPANSYMLETVMTHELGHAFGLGHSQTGPFGTSVMECEIGLGELIGPESDDVSGQRYIYGGGPGGTPTLPPCSDS